MKFAVNLASSQPNKWLSWLVAASLMFPLVFFGLVAHQSRVATLAATDQQLVGTVTLLREHAKKVLDTDELVIQQVDRLITGLSWEAIAQSDSLHQQLKQLDRQLPQVGGIFVVAPDGTIANSSRPMPAQPINVSESDYFAALRDGHQGVYISSVYRGRAAGAEQFDFARRHSSPDGHFDGVIDISDRPIYFADTYRNIGDSASIALMRNDGQELAYYPRPMFSDARAPIDLWSSIPEAETLLVSSVPSAFDQIDRLGAFQRIQDYPLFVGYTLPRSTIMANWRMAVVLDGTLIAIGSLTVAFTGWLALRGFRNEQTEVRKRQDAEAKMEQARRMEVLGQLTAGVAHDFNNLLTVIAANIGRLRPNESDGGKKRVDAALSATSRGTGLIRQMLTFASRRTRKPENVDVNAALRAMELLLGSALTRNIVLDYQLTTKSTTCRIDRMEFELAVLNIATNSRHAMLNGGRLEVDTEVVAVHATGDGLELAPGQYVRVAFIDSGVGMPADVLARAFEPFFTTREPGGGTGLGLSQVYNFAKHSGGLATATSIVGRGTTVTLYIPILNADAAGDHEHNTVSAS